MNLNVVAKKVAKLEGKKKKVDIAQIKEVLGCYHEVLLQILKERGFKGLTDHENVMLHNGRLRAEKRRKSK